jgi:hypothetical protein
MPGHLRQTGRERNKKIRIDFSCIICLSSHKLTDWLKLPSGIQQFLIITKLYKLHPSAQK